MAQTPISQLPDGTATQLKTAEAVIEQDGVTVKTTIAPTPEMLFYAMNQTQLENHFPDGSGGILIPDNEEWTVIITESFTLSKPIKIGLNTTLEVIGASIIVTLTYTGTGAMFQNENPANPINRLLLEKIFLFSVGVESVFDIIGNIVFRLTDVIIAAFESVGTIQSMSVILDFGGAFNVNEGITLIEPQAVQSNGFAHFRTSPAALTFITILSTGNPAVTIDNVTVINSSADVVFFDPSSGALSDYTIQNTKGNFANLFVPGTDLAITSVTNAAGQARFNTGGPAHGYLVGDRIVHSGFGVAPSYNGTFVVNSVPTGSEYMTGVVFDVTDTGNTTQASRDGTDVAVRSINNAGNPDSMFTGDSGLEIFGSEQEVTINTISVPEVVTNAGWAFSGLERFEIGVNNEGQLNTLDTATRRYAIGYSGTIEKVGGGSVNVGIVLLKNGTDVSFNAPHTVNTGKIQISGSDIIELTANDTLQVGVINYLDTANIDVSQLSLVVNLA